MNEKQLMAAVRELAEWLGFLAYHTHDSRRSPAGFPDLVIAGHGRVLFVELKVGRGRLSVEQEQWIGHLRLAGCEVHVWRERDWTSGEIEAVLRRHDDVRAPRVHVPARREPLNEGGRP